MTDFFSKALAVIVVIFVILGSLFIICLPIAYFDGSAKSSYLQQVQGIDIPWYKATWLTVNAAGVNAVVAHNPSLDRTTKKDGQ